MVNRMQFYIDGAWVDPVVKKSTPVVNPATEEACTRSRSAPRPTSTRRSLRPSARSRPIRRRAARSGIALLEKIIAIYKGRMKEIGAAVSDEMGAPLPMAERLQAGAGLGHITSTLEVLKNYRIRGEMWAPPWSCASRSASSA